MKTQMKYQKILSLATLIVAALVFVYALCFFSGNMSVLLNYRSKYVDDQFTGADVFLDTAQQFVSNLEIICIVFFIVIAITYIMGNNSRRNYYVTNYVATGLIVAMTLFVALYGIIACVVLMNSFLNQIDWAGLEEMRAEYSDFIPLYKNPVKKDVTVMILGIVVFIIVLVNCVAWVLNLVWKIKLMKGEKALLAQAPVQATENIAEKEETV